MVGEHQDKGKVNVVEQAEIKDIQTSTRHSFVFSSSIKLEFVMVSKEPPSIMEGVTQPSSCYSLDNE